MTDNTEPTAFEIHLHCIRPLLNKTFEHEKRVSFELFKEMANQHFENIYGNENDNFLKELFAWFVEKEIFETVGNKYGGRIYTYNKSQESKMGFVGVFHSQFQTILRAMDREEAMAWRFEALRNSLADVEYDELEVGEGEVIDSWEPLPIDRERQPYKDTIEATESAIEVIEESNGYAANEPEERNAILTSLKGGFDALKNGFPTRKYIKTTLISGLGFIAKKFTSAAMGVAAKKALELLILFIKE